MNRYKSATITKKVTMGEFKNCEIFNNILKNEFLFSVKEKDASGSIVYEMIESKVGTDLR